MLRSNPLHLELPISPVSTQQSLSCSLNPRQSCTFITPEPIVQDYILDFTTKNSSTTAPYYPGLYLFVFNEMFQRSTPYLLSFEKHGSLSRTPKHDDINSWQSSLVDLSPTSAICNHSRDLTDV